VFGSAESNWTALRQFPWSGHIRICDMAIS
jgi:hypothetical protein